MMLAQQDGNEGKLAYMLAKYGLGENGSKTAAARTGE